jgi:hypothetical protein
MPEPIVSYRDLIKPLFSLISTSKGSEAYLASIAKLPHAEVVLHAAAVCRSEVCNGGFLQLFFNPQGVLVPEAIEGFTAIAMPRLAAVVQEASALLGAPYPREQEDRFQALLLASGRSPEEVRLIAKELRQPSTALQEVDNTMPFDALSTRFWDFNRIENGGFMKAATRYAQAVQMAGQESVRSAPGLES